MDRQGPAAAFNGPGGISDAACHIVVADSANHALRRVSGGAERSIVRRHCSCTFSSNCMLVPGLLLRGC